MADLAALQAMRWFLTQAALGQAGLNELVTHIRHFSRTDALVKDFGLFADLLGDRFGCFLFQLMQ